MVGRRTLCKVCGSAITTPGAGGASPAATWPATNAPRKVEPGTRAGC